MLCLLLNPVWQTALMAQPPLYLKMGAGVASDAGLDYKGPNFYGGMAVKTGRNVTIDLDYQYFPARMESTGAQPYKGEWRQHSISLGPTIYLGQHVHKGFYLGAGVTLQRRTDYFTSSWTSYNDTLIYPTLNLRLGFSAFPSHCRSSFFAELNLTGPWAENDFNGPDYIEIFTQLSLMVGWRIGWRREDPANDKNNHRLRLTEPY